MSPTPATYAALENQYDGAIPAHLLETRTALELQIGHHRAMIRFSETRIVDFTESLGRLLARPQDAGTLAWIARTYQIIAEHRTDVARHEAAIAALMPAPFAVAAE